MDRIHHIKTLSQDGKSISSIAAETGHSRNTIRSVLQRPLKLPSTLPVRRSSKSDLYFDDIKDMIEQNASNRNPKDRLTATRIYTLLKQREADKGQELSIALRTVQTIVRQIRADKKNLDTYLKLVHEAGKAQVDFGQVDVIRGVKTEKAIILVLTLPYSNAKFARLLPAQNSECLRAGLLDIFIELGGVPPSIRFDNMSTAVASIPSKDGASESKKPVYWHDGRPRILTENFRIFMLSLGFVAEFCNPASGNEKGSVENAVGFIRKNFFVPTVKLKSDYKHFNDDVLKPGCRRLRQDPHYKLRKPIEELFKEDKAQFLPLPECVETGSWLTRVVNGSSRIEFDKNTYQVKKPSGTIVHLYIEWDQLTCFTGSRNDPEKLGEWRRAYENNQDFIDWSVELQMLTRRGRAYRESVFRKMLPDQARIYVDSLAASDRRELMEALYSLLDKHSMERLIERLDIAQRLYRGSDVNTIICAVRRTDETTTDSKQPMEGFPEELQHVPSPQKLTYHDLGQEDARTN